MPLEPSPTARALLDCARRGALSAVSVGDSRLTFNAGRLVAVQGADAGLLAFLVRAGTLTPRDAREFDVGEDDDVLAALRERLGGSVLRRARRAAWIDRLVAVLDSDSPLSPAPLGPVATTLQGEAFIPILLDALARRAGNRDAGMVGAHAELVFAWRLEESEADLSEARRWLTYDPPEDESLARLLVRHPGAAPRLAALARAGFAVFITAEEAAEAPRSELPNLGRASLAPARPPLRQLTPGATVPPPSLAIHDIKLPSFVDQSAAPLEDPLFDIESRITFLEAMNAPGPDRAEAWAAAGDAWLQIHGALDEACRAYREAASADPTDVTALLQSARLCIATGQRELARAYASSATAVASELTAGECRRFEAKLALQSGERERAADLLRDHLELDGGDAEVWAFLALESGDTQLSAKAETILGGGGLSGVNLDSELRKAELLVRGGQPESAIHRLREGADEADDLGLARAMRLEAAEHAEFIRRPDLAFALLFDAFVRDASIQVLYEPLAHDALEASEPELRAVLLERFATLTSGSVASDWFLKAAEAFAALPGQGRLWSHELTTRALEADPASADALQALTTSADESRDANILADGLERAAIRADDTAGVPLFERLAGLAEARLGSVHRAAWAWRMVHARTGREDAGREALRLGEKAAVRSSLLRLAEEDLEGADEETRPAAVRRLAAMLRDHPEHRSRAASLYREYLSGHPDDRSAAEALRRLLALSGDPEARVSSLLDQHDRVSVSTDRDRLLDELTGLLALQGRWAMLAQRAQDWCKRSPSNHLAIARFELAARLGGNPHERRAARDARLQAPQRATHAPLWVERARQGAGGAAALEDLERALAIDPRCVPALIEGALLEYGSPTEQWERIEAARNVAPTDPVLLERAIDMSRQHHPEVLAELMRVAEASPDRARQRPPERFDAACESGDVDRAMAALDAWLASVSRPSGMRIVAGARLMAKSHPDDAARILVRATDQTSDPRLLAAADEYARDDETRALILERRVIWDDEFANALRELSELRRNARRTPSEARTLLRILADDPSDQPALTRLSEIYGECGEYERLYAIHALQRSASRGAAERERASIAMAVIAFRHLREPARARSAMEDLAADPASTETAAAVLSKLGDHRSAIDLLVRRADAARREHPTLAQRWVVTGVAIAETLLSSRPVAIEVAAEALKRGVRGADLMLLFERLTLREKDRETAMAVYDHLRKVAMGPHGRRGTTYRCARWLERLGDEPAALQSYQAAFHDDPGDGVILSSIERLARRSGQLVVWADALRALADRQTHVDHRLRVERRLVALLDLDMGDPGAALDRLAGVWEDTQKSELVPELRKLLRKVESPTERGAFVDRIVGGLRARIDSTWNSDDQAATLGTLAELQYLEAETPDAAAQTLHELGALLEEEEDIPRRFGADGFAHCADAVLESNPALAREYAERALDFDHEHIGARRVIEHLGVALPEAPKEQTQRDDAMSFADLADELSDAESGPEHPAFTEASSASDDPEAEESPAAAEELTVENDVEAEETAAEHTDADAEQTDAEQTDAEQEETDAEAEAADAEETDVEPEETNAEPEETEAEETEAEKTEAEETEAEETEAEETDAEETDAEETDAEETDAEETDVEPEETDAEKREQPETRTVPGTSESRYGRVTGETNTTESVSADQETNSRGAGHRSPAANRWLRPPEPLDGEGDLRVQVQGGDADAALALAELLANTPGRERESVEVLVGALRRTPWSRKLLGPLEDHAQRTDARAVLQTVRELNAFLDEDVITVNRAWRSAIKRDEAAELVRAHGNPFLDALGHVWAEAGLLFRVSHEDLGIVGTERVTALTLGPLGQAATYVSADIPIFRGPGEGVKPAPTLPPAIVAGSVLDPDSLPFRFAAAAALCASEHILIAGFDEAQLKVVVDAVYAAFGPPAAANTVSHEAAIQMGELWRTIPARRQTTLRQLVGSAEHPDLDILRGVVWECAGRAGYLADGRIAESLHFVGIQPKEYEEHMQRSPAGAAIVRLAFSNTLITVRS